MWHHAQPLMHGAGGWEPFLTLLLLKLLGKVKVPLQRTFTFLHALFFCRIDASLWELVHVGVLSGGLAHT